MSVTSQIVRRSGPPLVAALLLAVTGCGGADVQTDRRAQDAAAGKRIDRQLSSLVAGDAAGAYDRLRSVVVDVDGRRVDERYWKSGPSTPHDVQSVGKTVVGTLVGIALDEGRLHDLDQTVGELLPAYRSDMSPRVARVTLRQLLTMTGGMPDDDTFYDAVIDGERDWVRVALRQADRLAQDGSFSYASAGSHLLSAILQEATGETVFAYAREKLFTPMRIGQGPATEPVARRGSLRDFVRAGFAWPVDPQGRTVGGGSVKLTARELARLGELWRARGTWHGRRLVPESWERAAQRAQVQTHETFAPGYGYQQWVTTCDGHAAIAALGGGGQLVEVVPALRLVVVVQSQTPPAGPEPPGASSVDYLTLADTVVCPEVRR